MHGQRVGGHFLRRAVIPVADNLDDFKLVACGFHHSAEADMPVTVHRVAGQAAHLKNLAVLLAHFLDQEVGAHLAHLGLVFIDHHHLVGVEHVVERHNDDIALVGELYHAVKAVRRHGDGDNRVVTLIDKVLHRAKLGGNVGAGRDDLHFLDIFLDARLLGEGLGGLDHLNAPGVADKAVDDGDAVGTVFFLPLEELGLVIPGLETFRVGRGAIDDCRAGHCVTRHKKSRC